MNKQSGLITSGTAPIRDNRLGYTRLIAYFFLYATVYSLYRSDSLAQTPTSSQLSGTWIGVHAEQHPGIYCPLPTFLKLDPNGAYVLGMVDGSATSIPSTWAVEGDSVRLDTIHFAPRSISLPNGLLRIGQTIPMTFRPFQDIPLDSARVYKQLSGTIWQTDSLVVALYANGKVSLENPISKRRTVHFWRLARFGKSIFLVIRGNQYHQDGGYKPLWQVAQATPKQIQLVGWNGHEVVRFPMAFLRSLPSNALCEPADFQACNNCFTPLWNTISTSRGQNHYDILQLIHTHYQPVDEPDESGLIRIRFVVNCEGQKGMFQLNSVGDDYCPRLFNARITNQLLAICREHIANDPALREPDYPGGPPADATVSLTFRLKHGRITDLLP